ncbi:hypothetical protein QFC20_005370 [Naganishia adeliensis]|uniref:Uncharacterized protein n=1 Tax=Naganishia adeliensis TaxID=92952 RepID=A0ACC2VP43_9TREE|nr:hypothetical protein QFC20_005370 [Naganishia adeliensis]
MSGIDPVIHGADGYRDPAIVIGPFKPSRPGYGPVLSYLQASQLPDPLVIHPLLNLQGWDRRPYATHHAFLHYDANHLECVSPFTSGISVSIYELLDLGDATDADREAEHPMFAAIWVDYDDSETEWIKERGQPATSPIVEELNLGHVETGKEIPIVTW